MAKKNDEMVKKIYGSLKAGDNTDGHVDVAPEDGDLYNSTLPDGITPEHVEKVSNHTTEFVASSAFAAQQFGNELFVKDEKVKTVATSIGLGAFGNADFKQTREVERSVPGSDKKVMVYGGMQANVTFEAGKNAGALGAALREAKRVGQENLSKN